MKTSGCALYATLLCILLSSNQVYGQNSIDFGFKIGLTRSTLSVSDLRVPGSSHGPVSYPDGASLNPSISVFMMISLSNQLRIETELSYLRKEGTDSYQWESDPFPPVQITELIGSKYIQWEINAQYRLPTSAITPYAIVGPSVSYVVTTNFPYEDGQLMRLIFGYNLGLGMDFSRLFVEVKYEGDISKFMDLGGFEFRNRVWIFSVGTHL